MDLLPWPAHLCQFGPVERKDMSCIKKISGANLLRNAVMIPAATNRCDDAGTSRIWKRSACRPTRKREIRRRVTMLAFLIIPGAW
jgi:pyruvate dehydrogenase E2 component (dihydrolipoamide acetyltransferase)